MRSHVCKGITIELDIYFGELVGQLQEMSFIGILIVREKMAITVPTDK